MIIHLLIFQVVTFVVLLLVLRQLFYKQLSETLAGLQALHKLNLVRETELKEKIEAAQAEREELFAKARAQNDKMIQEAVAAAEKIMADVEQNARERAARIVERSQADLERKTRDFLNDQHHHLVEMSVRLVKLVFSARGQEVLQDHLLDELIVEIGNQDASMFQGAVKDKALVVSAHPISDERKVRLERLLSEKAGGQLEILFKEDPEVVAGLMVKIGALTMDGSLRNKLAKAELHLKK